MKIVAQMIAVDRYIHTLEKAWFSALMNTLGATRSQRKLLLEHLDGSRAEDPSELIKLITENKERSRLLNLLTVAMHADKIQNPSEKAYYQHIKHLTLTQFKDISDDYLALGKELQKRDRSLMVWRELGKFGDTLNMRRGYPNFHLNTFGEMDTAILTAWLGALAFETRFVYIIYAAAIGLIIFLMLYSLGSVQ